MNIIKCVHKSIYSYWITQSILRKRGWGSISKTLLLLWSYKIYIFPNPSESLHSHRAVLCYSPARLPLCFLKTPGHCLRRGSQEPHGGWSPSPSFPFSACVWNAEPIMILGVVCLFTHSQAFHGFVLTLHLNLRTSWDK